MLETGRSTELRAKDKVISSTLTVADNLKKELVKKAAEASRVVEENVLLKDNVLLKEKLAATDEENKRLKEEKKELAVDYESKVAKLTQLKEEIESW